MLVEHAHTRRQPPSARSYVVGIVLGLLVLFSFRSSSGDGRSSHTMIKRWMKVKHQAVVTWSNTAARGDTGEGHKGQHGAAHDTEEQEVTP